MNHKDPKVSFVVPCYNYGKYLSDCLNSIFSQDTNESYEVIVIDDASTDSTQDILKSFANPCLKVITHSKNMGHVYTINEGISCAKGEFIARIDPDDRYRPYFLSTVLPICYKYPDVGLVYGDAALINEKGEITCEKCDVQHKGKDYKGNEYIDLLAKNFLCAPTSIAKREAWNETIPIPDDLSFSDWYLSIKMARKYNFYYVNKVIADYRVHPENWHAKIIQNSLEEKTIFRLLEEFSLDFKEQPERKNIISRIYSSNYVTLGDKYFGFFMDHDAKRCYINAIKYKPSLVFNPALIRHLLATLIQRKNYELFKRIITKPNKIR